ncbi:agmatinase [Candidatus Thorarchaeota archaeon]|nr:MAG: agmatinase [Candidatus Thorarchaeota archaeon]
MPLKDELNGYLRLPRSFFGIKSPVTGDPDVGILGIPYDITSSHTPGARFGPDAIRRATDGERSHSYPLSIGEGSVPREPLSKLITLEDVGDLEVIQRLPEAAVIDISEATTKLATKESSLVFLGGDHFITYPILRGLSRARIGKWGIIYLDAHADLYSDMGGYQLSHATTLRRIIDDNIVKVSDVIAFDIRCALPEQKNELPTITKKTIADEIQDLAERVDHIYISIDLDVIDPSFIPGVSHKEAGGLSIVELVTILRTAFSTRKVKYTDIVELNPLIDISEKSAIAARDILKEILTGFASNQ